MAAVVKEAFGLLADHSYDPAYPAPTTMGEPAAPSGWTGYGVSVKDLLTAELLMPGTLLLPARDDLGAIAERTAWPQTGGLSGLPIPQKAHASWPSFGQISLAT